MSALTDLSQLPIPDVVETLDFETLFTARKQRFISLYPAEQQAEVTRTLGYESEPFVKLLQENTYLEMALRVRINEAAVANMLAHAAGRDLDNLVANFKVFRLQISPGDSTAIPPVDPVHESDSDLRMRAQQAFEGLSVAGPTAAYEYHARSADGRIADVSAISPHPCYVEIVAEKRLLIASNLGRPTYLKSSTTVSKHDILSNLIFRYFFLLLTHQAIELFHFFSQE